MFFFSSSYDDVNSSERFLAFSSACAKSLSHEIISVATHEANAIPRALPTNANPLRATCPAFAPRDKLPIDSLKPSVLNFPASPDFAYETILLSTPPTSFANSSADNPVSNIKSLNT